MKQAEFLNLETKQVQWLDASSEHPNLVRVPEGADTATKCGNFIIFWKNNYLSWCIGVDMHWNNAEIYSDDFLNLVEYLDDNGIDSIIWQRNSLQEKINEALSILSVNKAQLSVLLGREKSYVKRLLAKGRNVSEKTKTAVIDQLEQLIRVHEYESTEEPKHIGELTVTLSIDTKEVQEELKKAYGLVDQANQNSLMWQKKHKDQKNISSALIGVVSASIVFFILHCLLGVL